MQIINTGQDWCVAERVQKLQPFTAVVGCSIGNIVAVTLITEASGRCRECPCGWNAAETWKRECAGENVQGGVSRWNTCRGGKRPDEMCRRECWWNAQERVGGWKQQVNPAGVWYSVGSWCMVDSCKSPVQYSLLVQLVVQCCRFIGQHNLVYKQWHKLYITGVMQQFELHTGQSTVYAWDAYELH